MMSSISSVRRPRSDLWTPTASYSTSFQPTPAPRTTRLSDRNWSVASSLAGRTGVGGGARGGVEPGGGRGIGGVRRREPPPLVHAGGHGERQDRLEPVHRVEA